MFLSDTYSLSVLWPSLFGVVIITVAMVWGSSKLIKLASEDPVREVVEEDEHVTSLGLDD